MADDLRDRLKAVILSNLPEHLFPGAAADEFAGRLADSAIAIRDADPGYWRERAEKAERLLAAVRHLRDVYEQNARTADDVKTRNWFELFVEELDTVLDSSSRPPETPAKEENQRP